LAGGLNIYGYVGGNPLRWIDQFGLDAIDVNNILINIGNMFPNLYVPQNVTYNILPPGIDGRYDRPTDIIILPPEQETQCLSENEFVELYQTLYHETLHANQTWYNYTYDFWYELFIEELGPDHQRITDQTTNLVTGIPGQQNTSIFQVIQSLYQNTRNR
jgi:hypothetical protein